jgi:hypothetical protein
MHGDISIGDYEGASAQKKKNISELNHRQAGDPAKFGDVIVALAAANVAPVRFAAGTDAYSVVKQKAEALVSEANVWRSLSTSTDIDR